MSLLEIIYFQKWRLLMQKTDNNQLSLKQIIDFRIPVPDSIYDKVHKK